MLAEHSSILNGGADDLEVRGDEAIKRLFAKYDTFLFDCDGVIWHGPAGDQLTVDAVDTIHFLKRSGKQVAFVTNNATKSRKEYLKKFQGFGFAVELEEIYTSGSAAAEYVRAVVSPSIADATKRNIYLIGQKAMEDELASEGLTWTGGTDPQDDVLLPPQDFSSILSDPSIGIVLYSFQMRINYKQLTKAYNYLASNPGCQLVLTNDDQSMLLPDGGYAPGEGAIASVLYGALPRGQKPIVVGKPYQPLLDVIKREINYDRKRTVFIGDRLETDVLFAKRGEIDSILVWTGISKPKDLHDLTTDQAPDYTLSHIGAFLRAQ
ncbi:hypothetical protein JCM8115_002885 [Rhodotorula mucilaginosa]|uniref:4-nitrophenylphosphatase n=1 Tax=Rhodotorula mucilaginosa TaxID=5537 RepID=A0A9P7B4E4_RHOMI|nr:hypothetical protein C6P46_005334 [Rhodotorula mucilaginosa]TKA51704.1 hypothetical protein B0A53_05409 [Rhodotorula sp. CCFEE 5036]